MPSIWQRAPTLFVHGHSGEAILLPYSQMVKLSVLVLYRNFLARLQVMPYASITDLYQVPLEHSEAKTSENHLQEFLNCFSCVALNGCPCFLECCSQLSNTWVIANILTHCKT